MMVMHMHKIGIVDADSLAPILNQGISMFMLI